MIRQQSQGFSSVLFALSGNLLITLMKFAGFTVSGSSALFSEAIHSFADTMNQSLLMIGIKKSSKAADEQFAYGYGQERFLWALISACGIFFLGAGVTVVNGINTLRHPAEVHITSLSFVILIISFIVESITFYIAFKELKKNAKAIGGKSLFKDGDPTTIAVIYEDGVALLGVLVAFVSIMLYKITGNVYWDAAGSIIVGILLAAIAVILINKNRAFLIKKSIPEPVKKKIIKILEADPVVEKVLDFKSTILDVGSYHIKCEIEFNGSALLKKIEGNDLKEDYDEIKDSFEDFKKYLVRHVDRTPRIIGQRIDEIEKRIQKEVPGIEHIDIEVN